MLEIMLQKVRIFMENNKYLRKAVPVIRNSWILQYRNVVRCRKLKNGFRQFYEAHTEELEKVEQMLADDFSRKTLRTIIAGRLEPKLGAWGGGNGRTAILYAGYFRSCEG